MTDLARRARELAQAAGYATPTPIQEKTLEPVLAGGDIIARAPTGTGKTAAFLLPLIVRAEGTKAKAIVIEPSRELAIQAANECRKLAPPSVRCVAAYGGTPPARQEELIRGGAQIIIGTPGRLRELLQAGVIKPGEYACIVLDEADRLLADQFLEDTMHMASRLPPTRQTLLFSVQMATTYKQRAENIMHTEITEIKAGTAAGETVTHTIIITENKIHELSQEIKEHPGKALVFCTTMRSAEKMAADLRYHGIYPLLLHSQREAEQRNSAIKRFKTDGGVLVATDVAARGIHAEGIERVYSMEPPSNPEFYLHRAGRTGRMGAKGACISICTKDELKAVKNALYAAGVQNPQTHNT